jgi:hypothetical protein
MLAPDERPPREVAGRLLTGVLSGMYVRFARLAAIAAVVLWTSAAALRFAGA